MAMENGLFEDVFPMLRWESIAILVYPRVTKIQVQWNAANGTDVETFKEYSPVHFSCRENMAVFGEKYKDVK